MADKRVVKDTVFYMRLPILFMFICFMLMIGFPTVSAYLLGDMTDSLLSFDKAQIMAKLPYLLLTIAFTVVVMPLISLLENYLLVKKGYEYDAFLFEKYLKKNLREIEKRGNGEIVEAISDVSPSWCYTLCELFAYPFGLVAYITFLFVLVSRSGSTIYFTLVVVFVPLLYLVRSLTLGKKMSECQNIHNDYDATRREIEEKVVPTAPWLGNWKLFDLYKALISKNLDKWFKEKLGRCNKIESGYTSIKTFLDIFVPIIVLFCGVIFVSKGELSPGQLLAGWLMLSSVKDCYGEISHWIYAVRGYKERRKKIEVFYDGEEEMSESTKCSNDSINLQEVSFCYDEKPVLDNISLNFEKGKKYRLIGENGAGKSTLIRLLSGLYEPTSGSISDGAMSLRKSVTLAEQTSTVFSGTVLDNLFTADKASAQSLLDELGFEKALEYKVKRDGEGLSPGEMKKLIITRALLQDRPFLILDEPFNHLDALACEKLTKMLGETDKGLIIISHKDIDIAFDETIKLKKE